MSMVNNSYGAAPVYGSQQTYGPQPVTYNPGMSSPYATDQYRPAQPQSSGGGLFGGTQRKLVTRESVMTAAMGAGVGFMIGGPIGALIGGIIGLLVSVFANYMKSRQQAPGSGQPGQVPAQQGYFPNQSGQPSANDLYYQRMQQQQQMQQSQVK